MEECAELIQAISKAKRGKINRDNLTEEIADVLICIEMLKQMYMISEDKINKWIEKKQAREAERMEKDINDLIVSKDTIRQTDVQRIIDEWNTLEEFGINPVKRMTSKREQAVKARIRQNHMDDILEAIENIRHSSFLQGQNKEGWMITFDWFLKPGNFAKVFEGNYLDKSGNKPQSYMEKIQNRVSEVDNWV